MMTRFDLHREYWLRVLLRRNNFQLVCLKNKHTFEESITVFDEGLSIKHQIGGIEGLFCICYLRPEDSLIDVFNMHFDDLEKAYETYKPTIKPNI
jgi:hypothetical protein